MSRRRMQLVLAAAAGDGLSPRETRERGAERAALCAAGCLCVFVTLGEKKTIERKQTLRRSAGVSHAQILCCAPKCLFGLVIHRAAADRLTWEICTRTA